MSSRKSRVVILAGGVGRRLAPYTFVIPKPIMPIGTTPILEVVLRQLSRYGFERITIALGHMSEIIKAVAGDGSRFGVQLSYSQETQPLGTVGPLMLIDDLTDDFIVMNADLLTDLNFADLFDHHVSNGAIATIAAFEKTTRLELGVLQTDALNRIVGFEEKPTLRHKVSMGIYVFNKRVLEYIPAQTYFGFDTLMLTLLKNRQTVRSYPFAGRWLDIGIPADYEQAQAEFEERREHYLGTDSRLTPAT
jgi:NDP-sugar pyrophosphorylase family protein